MPAEIELLSASILAIMYFGDIVFAISGALTAARYRMDVLGFVLIGTITGIGGGTTRDLLLGRTVWWTQDPTELILCVAASLITFFFITSGFHASSFRLFSIRDKAFVNDFASALEIPFIARPRKASVRGIVLSTSLAPRLVTVTTVARPSSGQGDR